MEEVIDQCKFCFVGFAAMDGTPYVIPMNFGYKDNVVYLHSGSVGRAKDILAENPKVCVSFCPDGKLVFQSSPMACSYSMKSVSVLVEGTVEFVEDMKEKENALSVMMNRFTNQPYRFSEPALCNVKVWKIRAEKMSAKSFGNSARPQNS